MHLTRERLVVSAKVTAFRERHAKTLRPETLVKQKGREATNYGISHTPLRDMARTRLDMQLQEIRKELSIENISSKTSET